MQKNRLDIKKKRLVICGDQERASVIPLVIRRNIFVTQFTYRWCFLYLHSFCIQTFSFKKKNRNSNVPLGVVDKNILNPYALTAS